MERGPGQLMTKHLEDRQLNAMNAPRSWRVTLFGILLVIVALPVAFSLITNRGMGQVEFGLWLALFAGWLVIFRRVQRTHRSAGPHSQ